MLSVSTGTCDSLMVFLTKKGSIDARQALPISCCDIHYNHSHTRKTRVRAKANPLMECVLLCIAFLLCEGVRTFRRAPLLAGKAMTTSRPKIILVI